VPDDFSKAFDMADAFQKQVQQIVDMLEGAVTEFKSHGWTDEQAREIVHRMMTQKPEGTS
jgi:hypothetical protein